MLGHVAVAFSTVFLSTPAAAAAGYLGAEQVTNGSTLQGIALIIGSAAGLIASIGAIVIGLRPKPVDPTSALAAKLLEKQLEKLIDGDTDTDPSAS